VDEKPHTVFYFNNYRGKNFNEDNAYFELSKDESELRLRYYELRNNIIEEYLMTETTPGKGFTKIDK
jgi:hypothetical protein